MYFAVFYTMCRQSHASSRHSQKSAMRNQAHEDLPRCSTPRNTCPSHRSQSCSTPSWTPRPHSSYAKSV